SKEGVPGLGIQQRLQLDAAVVRTVAQHEAPGRVRHREDQRDMESGVNRQQPGDEAVAQRRPRAIARIQYLSETHASSLSTMRTPALFQPSSVRARRVTRRQKLEPNAGSIWASS